MALADVEIDPRDLPFLPPPSHVIAVDLPVPPSVNQIWRQTRGGKGRVYLDPAYRDWKKRADMAVMAAGALRGMRTIPGPFEVRIVLERGRGDLDNRIKALLDWAQSRELIANDKHCERIIAEWGEAPAGCRLVLRELGVPRETSSEAA